MEIVACIHNALYANAAYSVICNVIQLDKQTIKPKQDLYITDMPLFITIFETLFLI